MEPQIIFLIFCNYQYLATMFKTKFRDIALFLASGFAIVFNSVALYMENISHEWILSNAILLIIMAIYNKNKSCRLITISLAVFAAVLLYEI